MRNLKQCLSIIKFRGSLKYVDFCYNFFSERHIASKVGRRNQTINNFNYIEENSRYVTTYQNIFQKLKPKNEFTAHGKGLLFTKMHHILYVSLQKTGSSLS